MQKFLSLLIALSLAGCAAGGQPGTTTISAQSAYLAVNTFNALKSSATAYDSLPQCGVAGASVACHQLATVKLIDANIRIGTTARNQVMALLKQSCPSGGATPITACPPIPITAYQGLQSVITTLQSAYTQYGVTNVVTP